MRRRRPWQRSCGSTTQQARRGGDGIRYKDYLKARKILRLEDLGLILL